MFTECTCIGCYIFVILMTVLDTVMLILLVFNFVVICLIDVLADISFSFALPRYIGFHLFMCQLQNFVCLMSYVF